MLPRAVLVRPAVEGALQSILELELACNSDTNHLTET